MGHSLRRVIVAGALAAGALAVVNAQQAATVSVLPVQGAVTLITAGDTNIAVQVGKNGVVLVDTPPAALVPQVMDEIRKLVDRPAIRYIVNTSMSPDRVSGNAALVGPAAARGTGGAPFGFVGLARPSIIAHENVLNRMSSMTPALPAAAMPTTEYFMPTMDFYANDEPIILYHEPAAHTDGDSIVLFRKSDVIVTGDIYTPDRYPVIDTERGGTVDGLVKALGTVLSLAVPEAFESGGTRIIPGRGRIGEETDVAEFRDMIVIIRNRIEDGMKKQMTLDQIKASRPSQDYDAEYGASQAEADRFVETIYRTIPAPPAPTARPGAARPAGGRS